MKSAALVLALVFLPLTTFAQSSAVQFQNSSTTLLTTNSGFSPATLGTMPANGLFRIGLYVGPQGSPASSLVLVGVATNSTVLAGRFSGGNPFFLPAPFNTDQTIAFQIKGWLGSGGNSYEQAVATACATGNPSILLGVSALGQVTTATPPAPVPALFGAAAGQVGGFNMGPFLCPEPGTYALAALGAASLGILLRQRRR